MKTNLLDLNKTDCPSVYLLDLYTNNLLPPSLAWQIENHLCDCLDCQMYIEKEDISAALMDSLDAQFAVRLFWESDQCKPVPEYEAMMEMVLMSAAIPVTIEQPHSGVLVSQDSIVFQWTGSTTEQMQLKIENNLYDVIIDNDNIQNNFALPLPQQQFPDGLYYFKLSKGIDLVKIGKFYVYRGNK